MDLSRRFGLPPLILLVTFLLCIQRSQSRFFGDRLKRQNGANMYLPASSIVPGGEGDDPNEWSEWSSPSECSRSCGGGVSFQSRECLRIDESGAPICTGGNRKYFSCNTQDCPEDEPDFRAQQCSRFDHQPFNGIFYEWVPYMNAKNPCQLNCMPKGERFYYPHKAKVIDGTRCNDQSLDVCVDGQCQPVGCDMMLGSDAKEDNCRKCGGNGKTCRTISDKFTTNNLAAGYNDILLVPSGATNIRIQETLPSNNYLSCRNLSSHYYLNGNWRIDFPRPMFFAGSWWNYQRKPTGFAAPDQLSCRGPITESIFIVMLVQDKNVSIEYEYSIPQSVSSTTPDVYTWTHMEFGPCSTSCGGGTQTRAVTCNNRFNLEEVEHSFCDEKAKPTESQVCGTEPCAPHWITGEWGKCSKGCGSDGIQNRTVTCERISPTGEHTVEDDAVCLQEVGNKPANQQECNRDIENCPKYHLGPWSPCDKLCGEGKQMRKVTCYIEENGRKKVLSDEECIEEKPETEKMCLLTPCEGVDWIISQWSGCDACGQTMETRTAICASKSGKIYDDKFCAPEVPLLSKPCESTKCKTQWFTSEWSKCSSSCGKGIQSRVVLCGEFDGKTITKVTDDSQCNADIKPDAEQECEGEDKECPGQWFTGPWEPCSKNCGGGERQREVLCLANGTKSSNCDESKIEALSEKCNTQACTEDEIMPVESTDEPITDEEYEDDCEGEEDDEGDEEDDYIKLVTDKISEDLKISEGIDLDEKSTMSSLMTDELMLSDSTPAVDTTDVEISTDLPLSTVEGSGDHSESTELSSVATEGSGDDFETSTYSSLSTDISQQTDTTIDASSEITSTDLSESTDQSETTDVTTISTDIPESTDSSSTDSSTDSSTIVSETTDESTKSSSTDVSEATGSSQSTELSPSTSSTESSSSTDVSSSSDATEATGSDGTDSTTSSSTSSELTEPSVSTVVSTEVTETSISTDAFSGSESTESTLTSEILTTATDFTDTSTSTTDSTESSISTDSTTDFTTESSVSTDSTTDISTESSISTSTIISSTSDSSTSTDSSVSSDSTSSTEISTSTDLLTTSDDTSVSTDSSMSTDLSSSTDEHTSTDSSLSTETSLSTDTSASTDISTESSDTTESSSTDSTESSVSTDSSASTDKFSDSTESSTMSSEEDTSVSTLGISTTDIESSTGSELPETSTDSGISSSTESSTEDGSDSTKVTSESESTTALSSDETTETTDSDKTTSLFDSTIITSSTTSGSVFDSTTDSSGDSSLSTDEFTTIDIWTTKEDELEKSTPNTLQAAITKETKPKKCKAKKPKDCQKTTYGCCPDGKHTAKGPFDEGCPIAKTCAETKFGCCHDGVSPATGKNYQGCPKSQCKETLFGCCPDKFTPAEGEDDEGCPEPTTLPPTTTTEMPKEETTDIFEPKSSGMPETTDVTDTTDIPDTTDAALPKVTVQSCSFSEFGCCPDGKSIASGENFAGCEGVVDPKDCRNSVFGCCNDGRTSATGPNREGCAACTYEPFGCCPDNETPAHGSLGEGCCLNSPYGCCPDNINSARGPNFEDCDCKYSPYGCCPDNKTSARGPNSEGCGCESTEFGCCPDKLTAAKGPKFEGCPCHTLQFGCCPDGITIAQGPHHYGCHCSQTEFKCCPDEKTPAKGPEYEGCTCLESKYGCCPDGVTSAKGDKFEGCENVKEPPQLSCKLHKETGPCGNFSIKYFFDTSYGACAKFWYGGCDGNGNRFDTESECKETCQDYKGKEACLLPKSQGPCTGFISKWYFDADRGRCEEFKYGGCYGTNNRFDSLQECQSLCTVSESIPPCEQPMDEGPCEGSFERWYYDNATDVCRPFSYGGCKGNKNNYPTEHACNYHCRQPGVHKDYCSLPKKIGDCSEKHARWHYSEEDKKCMPFYYSGCGGNKNNFPSLESCEDHCPKEVAKDICEIPAEVGECTNYQPMWYYDTKDQRCRQFYYGGCGGNENKFNTEDDCLQRCEKKPEPVPETIFEPVPPSSSVNVCEEKADPGSCGNYTLIWYFDKDESICRQFYYGGCGGSGNRFNSEMECKQQCVGEPEPKPAPAPAQPENVPEQNICELPQDTGDCDRYTQMWYYNPANSSCSMFYYGGCGGNSNRFASEEECNYRCASPPGSDVEESSEPDESRKCFLPVETGNCLENEVRWHYNSADGICEQFVYTGCGGNENNYATEAECEDECFPVHETCVLPPLKGNCNESLIRWHFNHETRTCSEFEFTGCLGNRNNFVTEQECLAHCGSGEAPAPSYSVCDQPLEAGECDNSTTAWYYDNENMICIAFTYTGCGGNGNRFQSREQCERQCGEFKGVDVCNEDVSSGPCRQWETRYYFNKQTRTCEPFTYGGCQGTGNRFENRGECESVCIIGQEPTYSHNKDICKQQVDVGRCNGQSATERRWYYDDARGNCVSFIYSGCAGNQNNFRSYESCYNFCSKPDITNEVLPNRCESYENECSTLSCPYGIRRVPVDDECNRCECNNPCEGYHCAEGQQCAIEVSPEVSGQFVPVCRFVNKPGVCPQLTAGGDGPCGRECYTDADCRSDNKCCSNGCGFVCVRPTPPTIRTTAPTTVAPVVVYPGEVRVSLIPKPKPELDVQTPMGGIAVLRCFATGNPAPNVTWSRNNIVVDTNQGRYVLTSSGDLTIVQVRQTDSGSYVCVASNGIGEPVRREIELQVTEPVNMPAYVYGDRNVTQIVTLNRPAVVRCPAGGHPAPMVNWWRNRNRLPLISQRFELARDYSLTFRSVQLSDLGPYTCEAWNRLSRRPASIKVTLVAVGPARAVTNDDAQYLQYIIEPPKAPVTQRPTFPYRPTRPPAIPPPYVVPTLAAVPVSAVIGMDPNNNYTPGSTIAMGCSVQGYPKPNVTWIKDGLPLLTSERIQFSIDEPYRLVINNINAADSGRYGCKAANAVSYSISEESVNVESTIPLNPECIDNEHFANCKLIVQGRYCKNRYYAKFCCRSCALAGQL